MFEMFAGVVARIDVFRTPRGPTFVTVVGPVQEILFLFNSTLRLEGANKATETSTSRHKRVWRW